MIWDRVKDIVCYFLNNHKYNNAKGTIYNNKVLAEWFISLNQHDNIYNPSHSDANNKSNQNKKDIDNYNKENTYHVEKEKHIFQLNDNNKTDKFNHPETYRNNKNVHVPDTYIVTNITSVFIDSLKIEANYWNLVSLISHCSIIDLKNNKEEKDTLIILKYENISLCMEKE